MYILNETRSPYDSTDVCSAASLPKKHLAGADRSPSDAYSQPAVRPEFCTVAHVTHVSIAAPARFHFWCINLFYFILASSPAFLPIQSSSTSSNEQQMNSHPCRRQAGGDDATVEWQSWFQTSSDTQRDVRFRSNFEWKQANENGKFAFDTTSTSIYTYVKFHSPKLLRFLLYVLNAADNCIWHSGRVGAEIRNTSVFCLCIKHVNCTVSSGYLRK